MENIYLDVIDAIEDGTVEPKVEGIFVDSTGGKNPVYVHEDEDNTLQFINSSNQEPLTDFSSLLSNIQEVLEDEECEGEVYDPMTGNQIWFEIFPNGAKGSLIK